METLSADEVLKSDENNFVISYSQVERVEVKKFLGAVQIKMVEGDKKYTWSVRSIPHSDVFSLDDVKRLLEPLFG